VEGPLGKSSPEAPARGSFIVSGRRTYFDVFTRAINERNADVEDYQPIPDYFFYDLNAKASYRLGEKDELFATGYLGRDVFGFNSNNGFNFDFNWGNTLGVVRWQHTFNPRLIANTSVSITDYQYGLTNKLDQFRFSLGSTIRDYTGRLDVDWMPNERHTIKLGAVATEHRFGVGRLQAGSDDNSINFGADIKYAGQEVGLYASDNIKLSDKLQVEGGLRLSGFQSGSDRYAGLEPRASARYSLSANTSLKASYALMYQYVHLVTNSGATLPTDIWYPSRLSVKPQRSQQVSTGVSFLLGKGSYLLTNEVYYKWAQNQIDFKDGAQLFVNAELDEEFLFGKAGATATSCTWKRKAAAPPAGWATPWPGPTAGLAAARHPRHQSRRAVLPGLRPPPQPDRSADSQPQRAPEPDGQLRVFERGAYYPAAGPLCLPGHQRRNSRGCAHLSGPQHLPPHPLSPARFGRGLEAQAQPLRGRVGPDV
jgi:hypothetical protein